MKKVNLKKFHANYSKIVHEVAYLNERYTICKLNKPMSVMVSYDDWLVIEKLFKEINDNRKEKVIGNFLEILSYPEIPA